MGSLSNENKTKTSTFNIQYSIFDIQSSTFDIQYSIFDILFFTFSHRYRRKRHGRGMGFCTTI